MGNKTDGFYEVFPEPAIYSKKNPAVGNPVHSGPGAVTPVQRR
jgi:hypothetical protein